MSSITRLLSAPHLAFDPGELIRELRRDESYRRSGRLGRTLVKEGPLRLILVVLAEGVEVGTHHAEAPLTVQPLEGRLRYRVDEELFEIRTGELLYFGSGHAQEIRAMEDTALLLTVTRLEEEP